MVRATGNARRGFTLVELLVVIAIISMLVALTTAGVMKARQTVFIAKNSQQMDQITQASTTFCGQEVNSRIGYLPPAPFNLKPSYGISEPEAIYLKQLFPNLPVTGGATLNTGLSATTTLEDGNQVATFFLTGGTVTNYTGFSNNSQAPFQAKTQVEETRRGPYLQLQPSQYIVDGNGHARILDVYGVPYAIFTSGPKGNYGGQSVKIGGVTITPYFRGNSPVRYENAKTLQIISAGPNRVFGGGGDWATAVNDTNGKDDVGNFSTSNLGVGPP